MSVYKSICRCRRRRRLTFTSTVFFGVSHTISATALFNPAKDMSAQPSNISAGGLLRGAIALPFKAAGYIALEPVATGLLLYGLIKAPADIRDPLLQPLQDRGISATRIYSLIKPLKYLFALGVVRRVHHALSRLADNYWHLRQQGEPWKFGDEKLSELVLITGGCSGFGALMTKGFVGKARVVILDIQDVPEDLAECE